MGRTRQLLIPAIAAAIGLAILLNLGFWQLNRLAWKTELIDRVAEQVDAPPVDAPGPDDWTALKADEFADYQHVSIRGRFVPGNAFYYIALTEAKGQHGGPGYFVYTPFETQQGWTLLINRGFVPHYAYADFGEESTGFTEQELTLTGLLRMSEAPNWTTPEPDLDDRIWFARDTDTMATVMGVKAGNLAPYSIDLDEQYTPSTGLPQAGETIVRFKNDHLGYALTWFGLAATLIGVFAAYAATVMWPRKQEDQSTG